MYTISEIFGMFSYKDCLMGVEVEVEVDKPLPKYGYMNNDGSIVTVPEKWKAVIDGSLRGYSMEYVSQPLKDTDIVKTMIPSLIEHLKDYKINHSSVRVSTHVHVNVSDMTYVQCVNFATLWWSLENFFVEWCGDSRIGNNFCLRAKDASRSITNMIRDILSVNKRIKNGQSYSPFVGNFSVSDTKYSALNLSRVGEIGTFEFRSFGGLNFKDTSKFNMWIEQLSLLRTHACKLSNPQDISDLLNSLTVDEYAKMFLTEEMYKAWLSKDINYRSSLLIENEKFVGAIAYCIPSWKSFLKKETKSKTKNKNQSITHLSLDNSFLGWASTPQAVLNAEID